MGLLKDKKAALLENLGGGRLPSGYQEVEYIESNGTQYIDSGIPLGFENGFEVKFYNKSRSASSGYGAIFGCRTPYYELVSFMNNGTLRWGAWGGTTPYIRQNTLQECSLHNGVFTDCNGNQTTLARVADDCLYNAYVFGNNERNSFIHGGLGCRIYYLKLYYQNDLIRDFIPCYHKVSGEIGMYDPVTKTFFTNQGTGSFMKGPEV